MGATSTASGRLEVNLFLYEKRGGKSHFGIILVQSIQNKQTEMNNPSFRSSLLKNARRKKEALCSMNVESAESEHVQLY